MCNQSSLESISHGASYSNLQSDLYFDNDMDRARYTAILNYLKDFSNCTPLFNSDGHQIAPPIATDTLMDIDRDDCWKVYDSNDQ